MFDFDEVVAVTKKFKQYAENQRGWVESDQDWISIYLRQKCSKRMQRAEAAVRALEHFLRACEAAQHLVEEE